MLKRWSRRRYSAIESGDVNVIDAYSTDSGGAIRTESAKR